MTGEVNTAHQIEYSQLLDILPIIFEPQENNVSGLAYLPINNRNKAKNKESLEKIINLDDSYLQAFYLLIADCEQSQMVFYNSAGLRLLNLANNIIPNSVNIKLNLGISSLSNHQPEGLLYLHQVRQLQPNNSNILQALYLAYRDLNNVNLANYYYEYAKKIYQDNPQDLQWMWTNLPLDNPFTYVNFDDNLLLAVEASFRSIVTSVILAQQDWFEVEMEMW